MSTNNVILSIMNEDKWKYDVGSLVCCPRSNANDTWGTLFILVRVKTQTIMYYECYSQKANRIISMPKKVLEHNWYEPGEENDPQKSV